MVIKISGCILLVFASFMTGCSLSKRLFKRRDFLKAFMVFLSSLETNIRYNSADIFTLVSLCSKQSNLKCFELCENTGNSFEIEWKRAIDNLPSSLSITKSDKLLLHDFGLQLGKTDVEGQLKHIELYKLNFSKQLAYAEEAIVQKSKLYKTMGFFVGTATALMMI